MKNNVNYQALVYANLIEAGVRAIENIKPTEKMGSHLTGASLGEVIAARIAAKINKRGVPNAN